MTNLIINYSNIVIVVGKCTGNVEVLYFLHAIHIIMNRSFLPLLITSPVSIRWEAKLQLYHRNRNWLHYLWHDAHEAQLFSDMPTKCSTSIFDALTEKLMKFMYIIFSILQPLYCHYIQLSIVGPDYNII